MADVTFFTGSPAHADSYGPAEILYFPVGRLRLNLDAAEFEMNMAGIQVAAHHGNWPRYCCALQRQEDARLLYKWMLQQLVVREA